MPKSTIFVSSFLFLIALSSCGRQDQYESRLGNTGAAQTEDVTIKIESDPASAGSWIMVATTKTNLSLTACLEACTQVDNTRVPLQFVETIGARSIYRSVEPLELQHDLALEIAAVGISTVDGSQIYTPLKRIQIKDKNLINIPTLRDGEAGSFELKLDEVFRQGGTNWCWAYAAVHTMKIYFNHRTESDDPDVESFRQVMASIDSNQAMKSFMGRMVSTGERGMPEEFMSRLKRTSLLRPGAKMPWANFRGSRSAVVNRVVKGLKKGIPTAYCYPGHCVTIYGFQTDGTKAVSFSIADSANGARLRRSLSTVANNYTALWSLQESAATKGMDLVRLD